MDRIDSNLKDLDHNRNESILYFHQVSRAHLKECARKIKARSILIGIILVGAMSAVIIPAAIFEPNDGLRMVLLMIYVLCCLVFEVYNPIQKSQDATLLAKTGYTIWITSRRIIACEGDSFDKEILNRAEFQKLRILADVQVTELLTKTNINTRACHTFCLEVWSPVRRLQFIEGTELIPLTSILTSVCDHNVAELEEAENLHSPDKKVSEIVFPRKTASIPDKF